MKTLMLILLNFTAFNAISGELTKKIFTPSNGCGIHQEIKREPYSDGGNSPCSLVTRKFPITMKELPTTCSMAPSVVDSTDYSTSFPGSSALTDEGCDGTLQGQVRNYWLTPNYANGADAYLIINMGCVRTLSGVKIRNTKNAGVNDRGSKDFSLFVSAQSSGGWTLVLQATMADIRGMACSAIQLEEFYFPNKQVGQFLKFQLDTFYHVYGGGVEFIEIV